MQASISKQYRLILIHLCILLLFSCTKDENAERDYPRPDTNEVSSIGSWGAVINAEIISGNPSSITEYGFVWSTDQYPDADHDDKQFKTGAPPGLTFSDTIRSNLKLNQTYYVRAYVKTDLYTVQGNILSFKSQGGMAPFINGLIPEAGTWGDTVRITGRYFGYNTKDFQVKLGDYSTTVVACTDKSIDFVIPPGQFSKTMRVNVSFNGSKILCIYDLTFLQPTVSSISPLTATFDDTLTVAGTNFSRLKSASHIYFNDFPARTVYASREMLKVIVPQQLTEKISSFIIIGPASRRAFTQPFTLKDIELVGFTPDTVFTGNETLTITARNLSPLPGNTQVLINGTRASITSFSTTMLKVSLPPNLIPDRMASYQANVPIRVIIGEQSVGFSKYLVIQYKP